MNWKQKIGDFLLPIHANRVKMDLSSFVKRLG
jgi:hypothetical protein